MRVARVRKKNLSEHGYFIYHAVGTNNVVQEFLYNALPMVFPPSKKAEDE